MITISRLARAASLSALLVACAVDATEPSAVGVSGGGPAGYADVDGGTTGTSAPSAYPILAQIETNQTMTAAGGQGVGVFSEYVAGGHWHVWWTCDTNVNPASVPCAFDVKITPQSGSLSNVVQQDFETGDQITTTSQQLEATTTVTTGLDGVNFDTSPGATILLSATVGSEYDGRFIFFVDNGQIDDGFQGTVTDPIQFQPSTP